MPRSTPYLLEPYPSEVFRTLHRNLDLSPLSLALTDGPGALPSRLNERTHRALRFARSLERRRERAVMKRGKGREGNEAKTDGRAGETVLLATDRIQHPGRTGVYVVRR